MVHYSDLDELLIQCRSTRVPSRDRIAAELGAIRRLLQVGMVPPIPDHWLRERGDRDTCANCGQVLTAHWFDGEWDRCRAVPFRNYQARLKASR